MSDGFEIREITNNKKDYLPLLLLADEQESMIDKYINRAAVYVLFENGAARSLCAVTDESDGTYEIKALATDTAHWRRGLARQLLTHVFTHYAGHIMLVGTGETPGILAFYEKCGFMYSHRVKNFFTDNYDHVIIDDGIVLRDMVYLKQQL